MKENYVLTIKAEDRPGLLHLITGIVNRKLIAIESLTAAKTGISGIVLITVELIVSEKALTPLVHKIENIIEVFAVEARLKAGVIALGAAYFKFSKEFISSPQAALLWKHGAQVINIYPDAILVSKCGRDAEIRALYNLVDGEHLIGFSQTGLIADSKLIGGDESSVINRLAA